MAGTARTHAASTGLARARTRARAPWRRTGGGVPGPAPATPRQAAPRRRSRRSRNLLREGRAFAVGFARLGLARDDGALATSQSEVSRARAAALLLRHPA